MNIIQITDLHMCREGGRAFLHADSTQALRNTVDYLLQSRIQIDLVAVCGDVSNDGSLDSYYSVNRELSRLPCPVYYVPGNHDSLRNMTQAGLLPPGDEELGCRFLETSEASIILLDSTKEGKSFGALGNNKTNALKECLKCDTTQPAFLFMHHVPFVTGYAVMDEPFEEIDKLVELVQNRENLYLCCGHIHAPMTTRIGKATIITCPPICMELEFDLTPKGGDMFYTSEPQFVLHVVKGTQVISHFLTVPTRETRKGPYTFSI